MTQISPLLFAVLLLFVGCTKDEYDYTPPQANVKAIPGDREVTLDFYLCNMAPTFYDSWCTPVPEAQFEVYLTDEAGNELKNISGMVQTGTFTVKNLTNGVNYYFKVRAFLGRNPIVYSNVVCTTPNSFEKPETIIRAGANLLGSGINSFYISPDFTKALYPFSFDTFYGIEYIDLLTGQKALVNSIYADYLNWSPDQKQIITHEYNPKNKDRYTTQILIHTIEDTTVQTLFNDKYDYKTPQFTPDGQQFIFISDEHKPEHFGLWMANIDGTQKRRIAPQFDVVSTWWQGSYYYGPASQVQHFSWATDGSKVYFSSLSSADRTQDGVYQLDMATENVQKIVDSPWDEQYATISPDGKRLAFMSTRSGIPEIWMYDMVTGTTQQVSNMGKDAYFTHLSSFNWSDNTHVYAMFSVNGAYGCYKFNVGE